MLYIFKIAVALLCCCSRIGAKFFMLLYDIALDSLPNFYVDAQVRWMPIFYVFALVYLMPLFVALLY